MFDKRFIFDVFCTEFTQTQISHALWFSGLYKNANYTYRKSFSHACVVRTVFTHKKFYWLSHPASWTSRTRASCVGIILDSTCAVSTNLVASNSHHADEVFPIVFTC